MRTYDVIVLGVGGMGSAALYHLARRGVRTLGIEQFGIAHDRGSSHGGTRICRKAYFEHPDYVPLLHRAYELWDELEAAAGRELFRRAGLLLAGPADGQIIRGVRRSAVEHGLAVQEVGVAELARRFPALAVDPGMCVLFEPDAGYLRVEDCVRAHVEQALRSGARIMSGTHVQHWSADDKGVVVNTNDGQYAAAALVICGGAWSSRLLAGLGLPLEVRRKVLVWLVDFDDECRVERGCPVFAFESGGGFYYGFPAIDEQGMKIGQHFGGETVRDPDELDGVLRPDDEQPLLGFVARHLPRARPTIGHRAVCMYTMTPDEHFIIDHHRDHSRVVFAAGFSGHGFKFSPVVGSMLADLALDGRTQEPIAFLRSSRPALKPR